MYTREEASKVKQNFWKKYGQYMGPVPSAEGMRINWINYKTGIKHLAFKMDADKESVTIGIVMSNPDLGIQELIFRQFEEFKSLLNSYLPESWEWALHHEDEYGKIVSSIGLTIQNVNIFAEKDWQKMIVFFKERMMALDAFWCDFQHGFELFK